MSIGFMWLRLISSGKLLQTRFWTFRFHIMQNTYFVTALNCSLDRSGAWKTFQLWMHLTYVFVWNVRMTFWARSQSFEVHVSLSFCPSAWNSDWGVTLSTFLDLVPRLRICGTLPPFFMHLYDVMPNVEEGQLLCCVMLCYVSGLPSSKRRRVVTYKTLTKLSFCSALLLSCVTHTHTQCSLFCIK